MRLSAIMATIVLLLGSDAEAQQRFQLERVGDGFIRLDTETGALTQCRQEASGLACRMAPDERAAYEKELALLEKRVETLEDRLAAAAPRPPPSEDEVDRTLSIMERFIRRFMGIVREFSGSAPDEPQPDRT
jgi:BMFP domain-containing protein YqiC